MENLWSWGGGKEFQWVIAGHWVYNTVGVMKRGVTSVLDGGGKQAASSESRCHFSNNRLGRKRRQRDYGPEVVVCW